MKNIELKIKISDFRGIEKSLKHLGAKFQGVLEHKDTYFNVAVGRLKLREINNRKFELIFYERPDTAMKKLSSYQVVALDKGQAGQLKDILTLSLGVKVVVAKKRRLWLWSDTRIHLDTVGKLGKFLELETVLEKISQRVGEKQYQEIYDRLGLDRFEALNNSYSDLLLE